MVSQACLDMVKQLLTKEVCDRPTIKDVNENNITDYHLGEKSFMVEKGGSKEFNIINGQVNSFLTLAFVKITYILTSLQRL